MIEQDRRLSASVRRRREALGLSQAQLAQVLGWPQAAVSRLETGRKEATTGELFALAAALRATVFELIADAAGARPAQAPRLELAGTLEEALAQLAAHGVRLLPSKREPALLKLSPTAAVSLCLPHALEPRLFAGLAALSARRAGELDWTSLAQGAERARLQNRLGALAAAAAQLKEHPALSAAAELLAGARLDRREYFAPEPRTPEARAHLEHRTPAWLRPWHLYGIPDARAMKRHLEALK